ncbi:MAG: DUF3570 domain-containing protein [Labilithrix sp.]|nr:DUF3570 domain-containing protein [Labilithrix sp.]MCW5818192.1 DUF3570 domain-containing protein [Labilithrix sp.]
MLRRALLILACLATLVVAWPTHAHEAAPAPAATPAPAPVSPAPSAVPAPAPVSPAPVSLAPAAAPASPAAPALSAPALSAPALSAPALSAPAAAPAPPAPAPAKLHRFVVERVETAFTAYQQRGTGYQSKASSRSWLDPGNAALAVFQPQLFVQARQSERIVHRFWVPIDLVTSASADAIDRGRRLDLISNSSRQNEAIAFDWAVAYEATKWTASARNNVHVEENFRSWAAGIGASLNVADDAATVSGSVNNVLDWFSAYNGLGVKTGRATRSTSNVNVGLTQILTPTTVVHANYGVSAQYGVLGNTWNSVPFVNGERFAEVLPRARWRHALVGRFAQYLPWDGSLKGFYRFYTDGWGVQAHAIEGQLSQRVHPLVYLRASYRWYTQDGVDFFTTLSPGRGERRFTADSDLGPFQAHTAGAKVALELPFLFAGAHLDAGYERYWRTDGLTVNVALWQAGARF